MRAKKLTELWMIRMTPEQKAKLLNAATTAGVDAATLARLCLREGLPIVSRMLRPPIEDNNTRGE